MRSLPSSIAPFNRKEKVVCDYPPKHASILGLASLNPASRPLSWRVRVRWEDGFDTSFVYTGELWIGKVSQAVHRLAEEATTRRREANPTLPDHLTYQVVSYTLIPHPGVQSILHRWS